MTKEELQEYVWYRRNIQRLEEKLIELETQATKMNSRLSDEPKGNSRDIVDILAKIIDTQNQINKDLERSYKILEKIEKTIEKLPEREKYLVRLKYIDGHTWEEIAVKMNYSWQHIHKIHSCILNNLKNLA